MKDKIKTRCALYIRKACDEEDETSYETSRLGEEFSRACRQRFGECIDIVIYHDIGFSGMHMERPELQRLLRDVQNREIDVVVYPAPHHLSRDFADHATLTRHFDSHGVPVIDGSAVMRRQ